MTTSEIVDLLRREARILAESGENLYRVRAYRQAAFLLSNLSDDVLDFDLNELQDLGLGKHLAKRVYHWAHDPVGHLVS